MVLRWAVVALCLGICHGEQVADSDSLQGALDAINRRQRDLQDPSLYYVKHFYPPREHSDRLKLHRPSIDDGQPEDIGYGYQKSLTPNAAGVFEDIPLLENELGSHDAGIGSLNYADKKELENIILDYISGNIGNSNAAKYQRVQYGNHNSKKKKSIFRERDINISPDTLQNLLPDELNSKKYFEHGEHPQNMASPFRERTPQKPSRHTPAIKAQALVKNFGGLNRDTDEFPENSDDSDEYLSMLNSVWEKYQDSNPDHLDPEDLSERDVEEIMGLLSPKEEMKKQHGEKYESSNDFFSSPLAWVKRDRQMLPDSNKNYGNQYLRALNLLNARTNTFEPMPQEEITNDEKDLEVARLLLGDPKGSTDKKRYIKRFWRGNSNREYNMAERFPVKKRSLPFYNNPSIMYHKHSALNKFAQRRKKNIKNHISDASTDPKVAQELSYIFSATNNMKNTTLHNNTDKTLIDRQNSNKLTDASEYHNAITGKQNTSKDLVNSHHVQHQKRSGQKEESNVDSQHKQRDISKKSVDLSDYFGIDKRHKKSKTADDSWLLDQYLNAYSISAKTIKNSEDENKPDYSHFEVDKKSSDDIDAKLRTMEDMIVDQAVKYTGAHEGMIDSEEIQAVKDRVIAQLAAAYSLEKMRKALSEFKTSISAQKVAEPTHSATNTPAYDGAEKKDKRISAKTETTEIPKQIGNTQKKKDSENIISVLHSLEPSRPVIPNQGEPCPIMNEIMQRCIEIANMAGDSSNALVPLCNLHQVCYLCGPEMGAAASGCDVTFLAEANGLCGDNPRCRYTVRRTLATMHSLRGDPSSLGCDWQNYPCLARYLAITM